MQFWKMNGAGNDFLVLNNLEEKLPEEAFPALARTLCERRLSIGADGLMVVDAPRADGDYRMLFYNSDGSAGEMCGNGARCICRYGYEKGLAGEVQANVNFCELTGPDQLYERTFERGVEDFTYACGTGTGSVVAVLTLLGKVSGKGVRAEMRGGVLTADAERDGDRIANLYLTGPTNIVCKGQVTDEELTRQDCV